MNLRILAVCLMNWKMVCDETIQDQNHKAGERAYKGNQAILRKRYYASRHCKTKDTGNPIRYWNPESTTHHLKVMGL